MPNVFRWAKLAVEDEHERMTNVTFGYISSVGQAACPEIKHILPEIVDLLLETKNTSDLFGKIISTCIFDEYEKWIEKSVTWVTLQHHEACRVMPNSDLEQWIFSVHTIYS